ncbi:MAG: hypothetical protein V4682_01885 [Patescibacteria group bacterium]
MSEDRQQPPSGDGWVYRKIFVIPLVFFALVAIVGPAKGLMRQRGNRGTRK